MIAEITLIQPPDPDLTDALQTEPLIADASSAMEQEDYQAAVDLASTALERAGTDGSRGRAIFHLAWAHLLAGRTVEARRVVDAMPDRSPDPGLLGALLIEEGAPADALDFLEEAIAAGEDISTSSWWAEAISDTRQFRRAISFLDSPASDHVDVVGIVDLCFAAHEAGDDQSFEQLAEVALRRVESGGERTDDPMVAYSIASILSLSGRNTAALAWLGRSIAAGFDDMELMATDSDLDPLRDKPKFRRLLSALEQATAHDGEGEPRQQR